MMFFAIPVALLLSATQPSATVRTDAGAIVGEALPDGRRMFRGVPFAAPPVGARRWKPPAAVMPWRGVREARRSAPACMQIDYGWNHAAAVRQSEDCLYLELVSPNLTPPKPLPVMVWIHGGGNRGGSGAGTIASDFGKQIVLVSLQYRLGALGFLSHAALTAEAPEHASGNYALMDQQAALRWVHANIARFGGDPANITIVGASAGAQDVGLQLLSPGARGLFHKAIEQSGTAGFGIPPRTLAHNEQLGAQIAVAAGAPRDADAARLRAIPAEALVEAAEAADVADLADDSFIWLAAVIDGVVVREPPPRTLARNGGARVPLIVGSNAREFTAFGGMAAIDRAFGANAAAARRFYAAAPDPDPRRGDRALQVSTDTLFACPAGVVADAQARLRMPTWRYEFDHDGEDGKPVAHGSELGVVMQAGMPPLHAYWLNFAKSGDPNGAGLPPWPAYVPARRHLRFGNAGPSAETDLRGDVCKLRNAP